MDVNTLNSILLIFRLVLYICASITFALVYRRLKFWGFITLSIAIMFSISTLIYSNFFGGTSNDMLYNILLLVSALLYLVSAQLVYNALRRFKTKKEMGDKYLK
jgi:hypothetical protein